MYKESEAALAAAPSLTPSAIKFITFFTIDNDIALDDFRLVLQLAITIDAPPFGLSMISTESALFDKPN